MPRRLVAIRVQGDRTHITELPIPLVAAALHLYWHRDQDTEPANGWLREIIRRAVAGGR